MIYFLQQNETGPVKIGYTENIKNRIIALQTSNPEKLRLLGSVAGSRYIERRIHQHLRFYHIGGEWFQPSHFVVEYIYSIPSYKPNLLDRPRPRTMDIPAETILQKSERVFLTKILKKCKHNKSKAAKTLEISRSTLYAKIKKYSL